MNCSLSGPMRGLLMGMLFGCGVSLGSFAANIYIAAPPVGTNWVPTSSLMVTGTIYVYTYQGEALSNVTVLRNWVPLGSATVGTISSNEYSLYGGWSYPYSPVQYGTQSLAAIAWILRDGSVQAVTAQVAVTLSPTNTPPVAVPDHLDVLPGSQTNLIALYIAETDRGQAAVPLISQPPSHGTLTQFGTSLFYTPNPGHYGMDSFWYQATDGYATTMPTLVRVRTRSLNDRTGDTVLLVVRSTLLPELTNEVERLRQDLANEGCVGKILSFPATGTATGLWGVLRSEWLNTNQWTAGAILIGDLPIPHSRSSNSSSPNDGILWEMQQFQDDVTTLWLSRGRLSLWVSRFNGICNWSQGAYGYEIHVLKRALDFNHRYRTGKHRLPHTAYRYWLNGATGSTAQLETVWPNSLAGTNRIGGMWPPKFYPDIPYVEGPLDCFVRGGDLLMETSHGEPTVYFRDEGQLTVGNLARVGSQVRFILAESCSSGALGGIVNHHILARIGGTIFAFGMSTDGYAGEFSLDRSNTQSLRAWLAGGSSWGNALKQDFPFPRYHLMVYGDLSCPVKMWPSNTVPRVTFSASKTNLSVGESVSFNIAVVDPDAATSDNPEVDWEHRVEWFPTGIGTAPVAPLFATNSNYAGWTNYVYAYSQSGRYTARVEVEDEWGARGWQELTIDVNTPPVANPDTLTVRAGQSGQVDVLANDTDADGQSLSVDAFPRLPSYGLISSFGSFVRYTATNAAWTGTDWFVYRARDTLGATVLGTCTVYVVADNLPPSVLQAHSLGSSNSLVVVFDKAVAPSSATNAANYTLNRGRQVTAASLLDARTVLLTTDTECAPGAYVLTINGMSDTAVPPNLMTSNTRVKAWVTTPIAADNFNSGGPSGGVGWHDPWASYYIWFSTTAPYEGTHAMALGEGRGWARRAVTNGLSAYQKAWISWVARAESFASNHVGGLEIFDGQWKPIWSIGDDRADSSYYRYWADVSDSAGSTNFSLRFNLSGSGATVLRIDDLRVVGVATNAPPWPEVIVTPAGQTLTVAEGGANATFSVRLRSAPSAEVTVTLQPGAQLSCVPAVLVFSPSNWTTTQTVTVSAVDDSVVEGSHTGRVEFAVSSADADYHAMPVEPVTVTITDNESYGQLRFSAPAFAVWENSGALTVAVHRVGGQTGAVSVQYVSTPISATPGADYTEVSGAVEWADGDETPKTIVIPIRDDVLSEDQEQFRLTLFSPAGGAVLGQPSVATVTILDNEGMLGGMSRRMKITFNYPRPEPLTNFPALVVLGPHLATQGFSYNSFLASDGADLRFMDADGATPLSHEIERWSCCGLTSYIWVRVPVLTNQHCIYAYWGNTNVLFRPPSQTDGSVWPAPFGAVWHLSDTGSVAIADSTANANHARAVNFLGAESLPAVAGRGLSFYAMLKQHLRVPHSASISPTNAFSVELWARSGYPTWIGNNGLLYKHLHYCLAPYNGTTEQSFRTHAAGSWREANWSGLTSSEIQNWHHYVGTYDGSVARFYLDGRLLTQRVVGTPPIPCTGSTNDLFIAAEGFDSSGTYFDGALDEIRIASAPLSSNWVWATFQNIASNSAFNSHGAVEILGGGGGEPDANQNGIPDSWELAYFSNLTTSGGTNTWSDADGDGMSDWHEFRAGTDPTNSLSRLAVESVATLPGNSPDNDRIILRWPSVSGRTYAIEYTHSLRPPNWTPLTVHLPATPPLNVHTVEVNRATHGFFRIVVE